VACAPDQPAATQGCKSVTDCALGSLCDRTLGTCIPEPTDRVLGAFACTVVNVADTVNEVDPTLHTSEIIGRVGRDRFAFTVLVSCDIDKYDDLHLFFSTADLVSNSLDIVLPAAKTKAGRATIGIATGDDTDNAAVVENVDLNHRYGSSNAGFVDFDVAPVLGAKIQGYADFTVFVAPRPDVLFGAPCPNGIADCGSLNGGGGGANTCAEFTDRPGHSICTTSCKGDGDCTVGDGICIGGVCTKPCAGDADCTKPTTCFVESASRRGCF
jgi:hypothetical protein